MLRLEHLAELAASHPAALNTQVRCFAIGPDHFDFNKRPAIMGVVNLSPDSWYRESVCLSVDRAVQRATVMHAQGANLIDLGAESTLAHAARAGTQLQSSKLLPVLQQLHQAGIPCSVETYLPEVAQAALEAGADVINLTGPADAQPIYRMAADHGAGVIICYVQGPNVREVADLQLGHDPIPDFLSFFELQLSLATRCGVERIFLDPGLGFYYRNLQDSAQRIRYQMNAFLNTLRLRRLGFPVCHALPHAFECFGEEVRCAEPFFTVLAALGRTDLFRTHEVPRVKAVLDTLQLFPD